MKKTAFSFLLLAIFSAAIAQWSNDPGLANNLVIKTSSRIFPEQTFSDGAGGAFLFFRTYQPGIQVNSIWVQRINSQGNLIWPLPVLISTSNGFRGYEMQPDNAGGVIVIFSVSNNSSYFSDSISIQRIDGQGNKRWGEKGTFLGLGSINSSSNFVVNQQNVFAFWSVNNNSNSNLILTSQCLNIDGVKQFVSDVITVPGSISQRFQGAVTDGRAGAVAFFSNSAGTSGYKIYSQRIDSTGSLRWSDTGKLITPFVGTQYIVGNLLPDKKGGSVFCYIEIPATDNNFLKIQRIDSNGNKLWLPEGKLVRNSVTLPTSTVFLSNDSIDRFNVFWVVQQNSLYLPGLSGQRLDGITGNALWAADGIQFLSILRGADFCTDNSRHTILNWVDTTGRLFTQKIDNATGSKLWGANGNPVSVFACYKNPVNWYDSAGKLKVAYSPGTGTIIAWSDYRLPVSNRYNFFAERIGDNGLMTGNGTVCSGANTTLTSSINGNAYKWQVSVNGAAFANVSNNTYYGNSDSVTLKLFNPPSSWYGYQYRCSVNTGYSNVFTLRFKSVWKGTLSNNWNNPGNWECGNIPDTNTDVVINNGTVLLNSNGFCRTITVKPGAVFNVTPGFSLTVAR